MNALQTNNDMTNPFDAALDADRHALWQILIARDSDAFAAGDWSVCDGDFEHAQFEGVSALGSADPVDWTLRYPTVESYRDETCASDIHRSRHSTDEKLVYADAGFRINDVLT